MNKTYKIAFGVFLLLVLFLTYLEATEPEPVNWTPSYIPADKIPLGSFVFFESWQNSNTATIEEVGVPPYEFLNKEPQNGTYFFLNNYVDFDDDELDHLLAWVEKGNAVFISADYLSENLLDTLNLDYDFFLSNESFSTQPTINLVNPEIKSDDGFTFEHDIEVSYFSKIDTLKHEVLGTANFEQGEKEINFLKTTFGRGEIILHTMPQAFSNYFLLTNNNFEYAEKALGYIKRDQKVHWDNYYKSGKTFFSSPLYILLNNKALKWAYYFVLAGSILFILFEGKRKQRAIPVVHPPRNQTYDYTQTIGDLYLEQKRYKELASKKIDLFLEHIRLQYRLPTQNINGDFFKELASQSGNSVEKTEALFQRIKEIQQKTEITKEELLQLSQEIQDFKQKD